jgi:sec-independent protein translocase protein TatA
VVIGDVLQPTHLIFILVVALLVLGPKRLPEVGRSLGKGIRDFRGALSGITDPEPSSPGEDAQQVMPVTPATTAFADEESPVVPTYLTASGEPVGTPSASSEAASAMGPHPVSSLPPHIEPDEPQSNAPAAKPAGEG